MHYSFGILVLIINLIILFRHLPKGVIIYFILSLLLPNIHVFGIILDYEIFAFLPIFILFILLLLIKNIKVKINVVHYLLFSYLILLLFSSFISIIAYNTNFNWISFFGHLRFLLQLFMLTQVSHYFVKNINKFFAIIISTNLIISVIQIFIPQTTNLFYKFYYKPSMTPLKTVLKLGKFPRAYGTFGSPVPLGGISLIIFTYFLIQLLFKNKNKFNFIYLLISLIVGLFSLTKTFILGVPLIIFATFTIKVVFIQRKIKRKNFTNIVKMFFGSIIFVSILLFIINIMANTNLPINWYLNYLTKPFSALETRYNLESGILNKTYDVIKNNILFGVGLTRIKGEFLGDSSYIGLLHNSGLIGLFIFLSVFLQLFNNARKKYIFRLPLLLSFLLVGISQPIFITIPGVLIFTYLQE